MQRGIKGSVQHIAVAICLLCGALATAWSQSWPARGSAPFVESIDAVVNGEAILAGEVEERMELIAINGRYDLDDPRIYEEVRSQVLKQMIDDLLIYQWGTERGIGLDKDQLERQVNADIQLLSESQNIQPYGSLEEALKQRGWSMERYRKSLARSNQRNFVIDQAIRLNIHEKIHISDAHVARYKRDHPDLFEKNQRVEVSQIFFKCPKNAPPEQDEETRARAYQVYLQIKAGADFTEMVRRYSDHTATRRQGGKMAPYSRGELAEPFDKAFDVEVGEICAPFRTAAGYHILRLDGKQSIEEYVLAERKREMLTAWLKELRDNAVIRQKAASPEL